MLMERIWTLASHTPYLINTQGGPSVKGQRGFILEDQQLLSRYLKQRGQFRQFWTLERVAI